jgi:thioredoxin-dependent peroxiredoxin
MDKKTTPEVGAKAPTFSLMATGGREVALKDFLGKKNLVLYFYPKDGTPGCTTEACGFRDVVEALRRHDTEVLGVSRDALESHERFSSKHGLSFPLLSDAGDQVSKAYGVFGKKSFMGREFYGIHRTTFVIDKLGRIRRIDRKVDVKQHAGQIVEYVKSEFA